MSNPRPTNNGKFSLVARKLIYEPPSEQAGYRSVELPRSLGESSLVWAPFVETTEALHALTPSLSDALARHAQRFRQDVAERVLITQRDYFEDFVLGRRLKNSGAVEFEEFWDAADSLDMALRRREQSQRSARYASALAQECVVEGKVSMPLAMLYMEKMQAKMDAEQAAYETTITFLREVALAVHETEPEFRHAINLLEAVHALRTPERRGEGRPKEIVHRPDFGP